MPCSLCFDCLASGLHQFNNSVPGPCVGRQSAMRRSIHASACGNSASRRALSPNSKAENSKPAGMG